MPSLFHDLRYGARTLRKTPTVAAVAILALTLGIGLTTTMFSIVYGVLMHGLPFPDGERIVVVQENNLARGWRQMSPSIHDYRDFAAQSRSFETLAGYYGGTVNVSGTERAERFSGQWVTANVFDIARVKPLLGRTFRPGEDAPGGEHVAVLGYAMWHDRYGSDPGIVGRTIRANGVPYTVVGVMPEKFRFPDNAALWLPLQLDAGQIKRGDGQHLSVVGRLRPGVTLDAANVDVATVARRLATEYKETNEGIGARVVPFIESEVGPQPRQLLLTMLGAVFLVLLIACANVANLLLDRAAHRTKEVGIRTALGATRWSVVRQFLMEALVLAVVGTVLGVAGAQAGVTLFNRSIADTDPPFWLDIRLYAPVLLFAIAIAAIASLASGAIPAYQSSRADISEILKDETRGASSLRIGRLSRALVMFEVALSCGLLVAAGLMIKSVVKLRTMDPGFAVNGVFTARVGFPSTYTDTLQQRRFFESLVERLGTEPGVRGAALASSLPANVGSGGGPFAIEGRSYATDKDYPRSPGIIVSSGYFATLDVAVKSGRALADADRLGTLPVAVVNEAFAATHFPGQSPIGHRVRVGGAKSQEPWLTIVGVVANTYGGDPEKPRPEIIYRPLAQVHSSFVTMLVRTAGGDPMAVTPRVRDIVASLDADIPIYFVYSMAEAIARPTWFIRVFGTMFMIFGLIALFLASVGLYAVMAFSVSRRTKEVGIRMALGAEGAHVVRMIFGQGLMQLAIGMGVGLALALGASNLLKMILFQVEPHDPAIFGGVVAVLTAAGLLACYVPALRATRVDPLVALRAE